MKTFLCEYFNNYAAWITSKIFLISRWIWKEYGRIKRNVFLFIDQCPAHPKDLLNFDHVSVVFFTANCMSKFQTLDLNVTLCLKVHHRKALILTRKVLDRLIIKIIQVNCIRKNINRWAFLANISCGRSVFMERLIFKVFKYS